MARLHAYLVTLSLLPCCYSSAQQPFGLDLGFSTVINTTNVSSVLPLPSGHVIVSGRMKFPGFVNDKLLARLNANGALDTGFNNSGLGGSELKPWNGMFYVGTSQTVRRIFLNGQQDPSFIEMNTGPYFGSLQGGDYHVYPDGRILMSGTHVLSDTVRGFTGLYDLIWFTNTGHLDTTRVHRRGDGIIYEIEEQPDGKFLCTGNITTWEGVSVPNTIRVHPDGALDTSFQCALTWGQFDKFTILTDGRIVASGLVKSDANSPDSLHIVRLMQDGTLDPTFNNDLVTSNDQFGQFLVMHHTVLADGRIVLHGNFEWVEGQARGGIALLDADGNLLNDAFTGDGCGPFTIGQFTYQGTRGMELAPDGSYYIYGAYHGYDDGTTNDPGQRMVSRLYGLDVGVQETGDAPGALLHVHPNPAHGSATVHLPRSIKSGELLLRDAQGRTVRRQPISGQRVTLDLTALDPGLYLLELRSGGVLAASGRLVVE